MALEIISFSIMSTAIMLATSILSIIIPIKINLQTLERNGCKVTKKELEEYASYLTRTYTIDIYCCRAKVIYYNPQTQTAILKIKDNYYWENNQKLGLIYNSDLKVIEEIQGK